MLLRLNSGGKGPLTATHLLGGVRSGAGQGERLAYSRIAAQGRQCHAGNVLQAVDNMAQRG